MTPGLLIVFLLSMKKPWVLYQFLVNRFLFENKYNIGKFDTAVATELII